MTPHFRVLCMSKVPRLPHILGFVRVRREGSFFNVFGVMSLQCFVETEAFRDKTCIFTATGSRAGLGLGGSYGTEPRL